MPTPSNKFNPWLALVALALVVTPMVSAWLLRPAEPVKEAPKSAVVQAPPEKPIAYHNQIRLVVVYASPLPRTLTNAPVELTTYPQASMAECKESAKVLTTQVKSGKVMTTCWVVKVPD